MKIRLCAAFVLAVSAITVGDADAAPTDSVGAAPEAMVGIPERLAGVNPARILDTRSGIGAPAQKVGPGGRVDVQVTGTGGVPSSGVTAVVLNVTVTDPSAPGYVTAWPSGAARPEASNLNFVAGQTIPNLVIVKVGEGGKVSLFNAFGETHLLADVSAYYTTAAQLVPITPQRLLDTRQQGVPVSGTTTVQVAGNAGVPAVGASAVVMNVTVAQPSRAGFITVWPRGESRPNASNLNFEINETRPNLVIAKLGAEGKVDLQVSSGTAHVLVDVFGYIEAPVAMTEISGVVDQSSDGAPRPRNRVDVAGSPYFNSLRAVVYSTPVWSEFNLGRQWRTLSTTLGHDDNDSVAASRTRFRILGDGNVLADHTLDFGQTQQVDVDVTGVLRVRFEVTRINSGNTTVVPVFVDPRLSATRSGTLPAPDFFALSPSRVLDTRSGVGAAEGRVADGSVVDLVIAGRGGVPETGIGAVVLNLTALDADNFGYVTAWPSGLGRPEASNINFVPNGVAPNLAVVPIGPNGRISLFVSGSPVHLIADVLGYYPGDVDSRARGAVMTEILDVVDQSSDGAPRPRNRVDVAGSPYFNSLRAVVYSTPVWSEFNLGRQWRTLSTTLGHDDNDSVAASRTRFRILGDGNVLADHTLDFGQTQQVDVDVTGVLRVRFEVTRINSGNTTVVPVFVDPELSR